MGVNNYSGNTYPDQLKKVFTQMKVGDSVSRNKLIEDIWGKEPNWFLRRSFDVAKVSALKGTNIKMKIRKDLVTRII